MHIVTLGSNMAFRLALRLPFALAPPLRAVSKLVNIPKEALEEGDDILDNDFDKKDPLQDPPAGIRFQHDPIPSAFWYAMQGKIQQKPAQPGYCCYPIGAQTWHLFNASAIPLGRMAGRIAAFLSGKHKPTYDHSRISEEKEGDFVVVVNGRYPLVHGKRAKLKIYKSHSTYAGGLHERNICRILEGNTFSEVVENAVYGMLPRTNVRPFYMKRLQVFPDVLHDLKHLPQLLPRPVHNELADLGLDKVLTEGELVFSSDPNNLPPHLQNMKKAVDDPAIKPQTDQLLHMKEFTTTEDKAMRRYRKVLMRFKKWNYKTQRYEI